MVEVGNIPASTIFFLFPRTKANGSYGHKYLLFLQLPYPASHQPPNKVRRPPACNGCHPLRSKSVTTHRDESTLLPSLERQVWGKPPTPTVPIRDNGSESSRVTTSRTCPLHYADAVPTAVRLVCGDNSPPTGGMTKG